MGFSATRYYVDRFADDSTGIIFRNQCYKKAVREATRNAGIAKPATCRSLRHSFTTHLL
jgi:site-specific recombinase XerD